LRVISGVPVQIHAAQKSLQKTHERERGNPFYSFDGEILILDRAIKLRNRNQQPTVGRERMAFRFRDVDQHKAAELCGNIQQILFLYA